MFFNCESPIIIQQMSQQNEFASQSSFRPPILIGGQNPETIEQQQIGKVIKLRHFNVEQEILKGDLIVFDRQKIKEDIINLRLNRQAKQIELSTVNIYKEQERHKRLKREILTLKKEEANLMKEEHTIKKKDILDKVKKWSEIQHSIGQHKLNDDELQQKKEKKEQEEKMKQKAQEQRREREEKKRVIELKLKQIEENSHKRQEIIKFSVEQYQKLHPKYLQIQKKFKQIEEEQKFEEQIHRKNHKIVRKIDHTAIKNHEKTYMDKVQERLQKRAEHSSLPSLQKTIQAPFIQFLERDEARIEQQKRKWQRRKAFQEKLKEIPIKIDEDKKMKIQITRDKDRNPIKYTLLSQKVNQNEIYENYQDFQLNSNNKELGISYLKELPVITQKSRVSKSQSMNSLGESTKSDKQKYKDYLKELKSERSSNTKDVSKEERPLIFESQSSKEKILSEMSEKSKKYDLQTARRQEELQGYHGFKSTIKKTKQIDAVYLKSIKAKLACIEVAQS